MGTLAFFCPTTDKPFRSNIHTDVASMEKVRHLPVRLRCPVCNQVHELTVKHARLDEDEPPRPDRAKRPG